MTARRIALAVAMVALGAFGSAPAQADFGIQRFDGEVVNRGDSGVVVAATQAGSHPDEATAAIEFNEHIDPTLFVRVPDGDARDIRVDLPAGFVGNPTAVDRCTEPQLESDVPGTECPASSQVGVVTVITSTLVEQTIPVFNMVPPGGVPGAFGFNVSQLVPVHLRASVRSESDYGITITAPNTSQAAPIISTSLTFWGVPGDPVHDTDRGSTKYDGTSIVCADTPDPTCRNSISGSPRSFITNPTSCSGPVETRLTATSWQGGVDSASFLTHLPAPDEATLVGVDGCDRLAFDASLTARPTTTRASSPSGFTFDVEVPQDDNPVGLAQAHLKKAVVRLPEGVTISPSAADGLQACSDAQAGLGSRSDPACPPGSKIGTVQVDTPLLEEPMSGSVYLGTQESDDPASGRMYRLFLVARGPGVTVKLPGSVVPDPVTGQLTATFDNNPQLPFSRLRVQLKDGPRAPLANPPTCGTKTTVAELTSWSGRTAESTSSFQIPCAPGLGSFAPSFSAGTLNPVAGMSSPFALRVDKPDGQSDLNGVSLSMPEGLLANLKGNLGTRIGTARVAAGPGANPFWLSGPVVLEGPYGDAPFSLRVTVPAIAGPFNLGDVVVRQKIYVDPDDARVTVVSDPLPTIVKGVPVLLQSLAVDVDKPGFMLNPTSCARQSIGGTLGAVTGQTAAVSSRFQVGDCQALGFRPRLAMRLAGRGQTRTGGHPALTTVLTQARGQANIGTAKVTLPRSIVLDANNSYDPKLVCDYDKSLKADCPASSVIGRATAYTPVLNRPLAGDVHLVQGIKFGPRGNRIRTTPSLLVKLRGEVAIDLRARTTVERGSSRLVTTFPAVPDAPVSKFWMRIDGGKKGILVVTKTRKAKIDLCKSKQIANVETDGQNGKRADFATRIKTPCGAKAGKSKRRSAAKRKR